MEFWYRYVDRLYTRSADEYGNDTGSYIRIELLRFQVIRHTRSGVQLDVYGRHRFVSASSRKRFAHATIEDARLSFIARKERQASIYRNRMQRAEEAIRIIGLFGKPYKV